MNCDVCKVYLVDSREVASPSSFTFVNNVSKLSQIAHLPPKMSSTPPNLRISIALFNLQRSDKREIPMNTIHAIIWCFCDVSSSTNFLRPSLVQLYGLEHDFQATTPPREGFSYIDIVAESRRAIN